MVQAEQSAQLTSAINSLTKETKIDEKALKSMLNSITRSLLASDIEFSLVARFEKNIRNTVKLQDSDNNPTRNLRKTILHALVREQYIQLQPVGNKKPYEQKKGKTNIVMFVGQQGAGKTTTVTKYAWYYQRRGWKVGQICADTFRAGAFDQQKQNAAKIKTPFYGSYTEIDPAIIAMKGVERFTKENYDLILIDTSGRHKQESSLLEEMKQVSINIKPNEIILVMDGSIGKSAKDQAKAFHDTVTIGSIILTKLDGHAKGGGALSAVATTGSPIIFIGTGEHIGDFEIFNPRSFASRLLGMGDISGLVTMLEEIDVKQTNEQLMAKAIQGKKITIRDISNSMQQIMSLGSFSTILNMLPVSSLQINKDDEKESMKTCKQCITIIDSMTNKELDDSVQIFSKQSSRIQRVSRGSGIPIDIVKNLLNFMLSISTLQQKMGGKNGKNMMNALGNIGKDGSSNINFGNILQSVSNMLSGGGANGLPNSLGIPNIPNMQALKNIQKLTKGQQGKLKSPMEAMNSLFGGTIKK